MRAHSPVLISAAPMPRLTRWCAGTPRTCCCPKCAVDEWMDKRLDAEKNELVFTLLYHFWNILLNVLFYLGI